MKKIGFCNLEKHIYFILFLAAPLVLHFKDDL
jgi:hypothetical protein